MALKLANKDFYLSILMRENSRLPILFKSAVKQKDDVVLAIEAVKLVQSLIAKKESFGSSSLSEAVIDVITHSDIGGEHCVFKYLKFVF